MSQCCCLSPQEERLQGTKKVNRQGRERVYKILDRIQFTVPHVDIERARYFTESMRQTEGELLTLRWAKALKNVAEKITVYITPDQLLAGRVGQLGRYGILYPEIDGDFYIEVMKDLPNREKSPFQIDPTDMQILMEEIAPYWEGKTYHEHLNKVLPAEIRGVTYHDERGLKSKFVVSETSSYRSALQWVPDYEKAMKRGFIDIQNEAKAKLAGLDLTNSVDIWEKKPFLEAMIIVCDAIMIWAKRHAQLARDTAAATSDPVRKQELLRMADICEHVPAYPARNFREAVQCQWFVQMFSRIEQKASAIISNGRMDQYLYPYYKKDIEEGTLTSEEAKELLECMWVDMAQFIDLYINPTGNEFQEGYAHWEAVTVGGQTPEGEDATNELSYLFLESKREFPMTYPDLAVRIHSRTPDRFLYEIALTVQDGSGFPKLINDEEVVPLNAIKGCPINEALDYAISGCTETRMPNRDTYTSGCVYINFATALEMLMNNGRLHYYGDELIGLETGDPTRFQTWEEFYDAYKAQHINLLQKAFQQQHIVDRLRPQHFAAPLSSVLHNLCMKNMQDLHSEKIEGGVDYSYFEFLGYATVVDSLAAIKKLVFEDKKYTLSEVIDAINANWEGYEQLRQEALACPKYGNDNDYVDSIAKMLEEFFYTEVTSYKDLYGNHFVTAFMGISNYLPTGKVLGATPDGRHAKDPINEGVSPYTGSDTSTCLAALRSAAKMEHDIHSGGTLLNLRLNHDLVATKRGRANLGAMLQSYFAIGGFHVQFNCISNEVLADAQKNPEKYRSLLVRVAGYSAQFTNLSKEMQDSIMARNAHGDF